ncbi:MAG TPA: YbfB/YjiJ family MFS transporter [Burkholderiales bacterium]|nr:YbfB/YjiJ family MFS transporter [Burkholderiales bacterium]
MDDSTGGAARWESPLGVALAAMSVLAVAMGIGRFAFTPLLPMMQHDAGLTLAAAGWLASANYLGYLAGALSALWLRMRAASVIRAALAAIVLSTAAMGATREPYLWAALRLISGIASAWAFVFASAWALHVLSARRGGRLGGVVYAGVGLGIALAGFCCVVFLRLGWSSAQAWIALGAVALLLALPGWRGYGGADPARDSATARAAPVPQRFSARQWRLIVCYGVFGFGYIVTATFLPAMARQVIADPAVFGWAWPLFGAAALIATLAAGSLSAHVSHRWIWIGAQAALALGVALPVLWPGFAAIALSALVVGGMFMVITSAGIQHARSAAAGDPAPMIAAMTAAFATGQMLGPVLVSLLSGRSDALEWSLIVACVVLVASAAALAIPGPRGRAT